MARHNRELLEREINTRITELMRQRGCYVLQEVRCPACEIDIVMFDPDTLRLAGFEIKRRDWRESLAQAYRTQLYCHFAVAVLPAKMESTVPVEEFSCRGVGVMFYSATEESINLVPVIGPVLTNKINRTFRRQLYERFLAEYGDELDA
jgi:hypothetical protein